MGKRFLESVLEFGLAGHLAKVTANHLSDLVTQVISHRTGENIACQEYGNSYEIYDRGVWREWRQLETVQLKTIVSTRLTRMQRPEHGPQTIRIPWADPMARFTLTLEAHAIDVLENARRTTRACELLKIGWATAVRVMGRRMARDLQRRKLEDLSCAGVVEESFLKGHHCITALNDMDGSRVLEVVKGRTEEDALALWGKIPEASRATVKAMAMAMWQAFENAARRMVPGAEIVHDTFHIAKLLNNGVNRVRTEEHRRLFREGDDRLKGTRWFWLRAEHNLTEAQYESFRNNKDAALKTSKAWLIKEAFRFFWVVPRISAEAEDYFGEWYRLTIYSKLEPMKKVAWMLREKLGNAVPWNRIDEDPKFLAPRGFVTPSESSTLPTDPMRGQRFFSFLSPGDRLNRPDLG